MKKEKLNNYQVFGMIDTLQIKYESNKDFQVVDDNFKGVLSPSNRKKRDKETQEDYVETVVKINPNELRNPLTGEKIGDCMNFNDFKISLESIISNTEIPTTYNNIVRLDFAFDSSESSFYKDYTKLHSFIMACIGFGYKNVLEKAYKSDGLFDLKTRSLWVRDKYFEVECYDKALESRERSFSKSRFEIRLKNIQKELEKKALQDVIFERCNRYFKKAVKNFDNVQKYYNDRLFEIYLEQKEQTPCRFKTINEFLRKYQDYIFTRKQLKELYMMIESIDENKANKKANNFQQNNGIEFISKKDFITVIERLKHAMKEYFSDENNLKTTV